MKTTMDRAGRLVIPKEIRREAKLVPGVPLEVKWREGRIEIEPAPAAHGQGEAARGEDGAGVGRHVVRTLGVVAVGGIGVGDEAREDRLQVGSHVGVRVLAQHERRARVLQEHGGDAGADAAGGDGALQLGGHLLRAATARAEFQGLLVDRRLLRIADSSRLNYRESMPGVEDRCASPTSSRCIGSMPGHYGRK